MQHVLRARKMSVEVPTINITVGIGRNNEGGFSLTADISATFKGIDQETAVDLVKEAHTVCPYSNATKGNIDVTLSAKVED